MENDLSCEDYYVSEMEPVAHDVYTIDDLFTFENEFDPIYQKYNGDVANDG